MQVKLLRVLQDLQFEPVGGVKTFRVDTRVILATNEDLTQAVAEGRIRQDLFYRINVINITLPNLRERISDIPLLVDFFLAQTCDDCGRPMRSFSDEAMAVMHRYRWPGNVRELQNTVKRGVVLGRFDPTETRPNRRSTQPPPPADEDCPADAPRRHAPPSLREAKLNAERKVLMDALARCGYHRTKAAALLGISYRTLLRRMQKHNIEL